MVLWNWRNSLEELSSAHHFDLLTLEDWSYSCKHHNSLYRHVTECYERPQANQGEWS